MAITVVGEFAVYSGYAAMNEYLVLGMHRAGARINLQPQYLDPWACSAELLEVWARSRPGVGGPVLYTSWMRPDLACLFGTELYVRSMYEASRLPAGWAAQLNHARVVIVPSAFVADTFRSSGVNVPIEVIPDGVDPQAYPLLSRPRRPGVTTLVVSAAYNRLSGLPGIGDRKHLPQAIAAWQQAFDGDPEARLILKCRWGQREDFPDDPRITLLPDEERTRGIAHLYQQADVLLALGSEGFGLPMIEGMATGLPVIALASEGQGDVCREAGDLVLAVQPASWEPHLHEGREECGTRGVPGVADVAGRLRWVAAHRDEAADLGRAASAWVHRHRSVWSYGPAVLGVIEGHTAYRRGLRRRQAAGVLRHLPLVGQERGRSGAAGAGNQSSC
jgi:glycosyltransferase involved in cell wall biosynthesis